MIQDVIKMDFPIKKTITFDTVVPLFTSGGECASEDIHWFGRVIEAGEFEFSEFKRYRFVEYCGPMVVERTIIAEKEIDINSDWSKSDIKVWPIYARAHMLNKLGCVCERYVDGCEDILSELCAEEHCTSIHGHISRFLKNWKQLPNLKDNSVYDKIITGKILDNIGTFKVTIDAVTDSIFPDYEAIEMVEKDPNKIVHSEDISGITSRIYLKPGLTLKDINKLKSSSCGLWAIGLLNGSPNRLFDPNSDDVQYGFTADQAKWTQFGLFDAILWSDITDLYFDADIDAPIGRAELNYHDFNVLNRYTGLHIDRATSPIEDKNSVVRHKLDEVIVLLYKLALYEWNIRIKNIKMLVNWWDEIYIEMTDVNGNVKRIWFDSTLVALGDPSLLPMLEYAVPSN